MPTLSSVEEEKLDEIIKECIGRAMTYKEVHRGNYRALEDDKRHTLKVTKQSIQALINQQIKSILDELDKSMPTAEQLTTKYGYHMPDKQYGYKLALHDIREVIEAQRKRINKTEKQ